MGFSGAVMAIILVFVEADISDVVALVGREDGIVSLIDGCDGVVASADIGDGVVPPVES